MRLPSFTSARGWEGRKGVKLFIGFFGVGELRQYYYYRFFFLLLAPLSSFSRRSLR
jgi:hypothetical protein